MNKRYIWGFIFKNSARRDERHAPSQKTLNIQLVEHDIKRGIQFFRRINGAFGDLLTYLFYAIMSDTVHLGNLIQVLTNFRDLDSVCLFQGLSRMRNAL